MNKIAQGALSIAVAVVAFYGVRAIKQEFQGREPTAAQVSERMDDLRARAESEFPNMPKADALKKVASEDTAGILEALPDERKTSAAADIFLGFYWANTKARAQYCEQRGVDLAPFTTAFADEHRAEMERATAVYAEAGLEVEGNLSVLMPELMKVVEQDMADVAKGAEIRIEDTCALFNDNAEQLAKLIQLPPHVKQALQGN